LMDIGQMKIAHVYGASNNLLKSRCYVNRQYSL